MVSLASEFPNDNPALHRGVIWVCTEPTGGARPERPLHADPIASPADALAAEPEELVPAPPVEAAALVADDAPEAAHDSLAPPEDDEVDAAAAPIVVEELEPIEASVEGTDGEAFAPLEALAPLEAEPMNEDDAPRLAPAPAHSEVVLVGTRVDPADLPADLEEAQEDDPALAAAPTPVFEEVVASEIPRETTSLPPASDDPFTVLVCTLADVAISAGSPHVASLLPGLLFDGRLPESLDTSAADALRSAGLWDGSEVAPSFVALTAAWRAILRGTSDDFDACGAAMLDEWASDLLARLLAEPARAPMLRQELRSRGIAAFGLAA